MRLDREKIVRDLYLQEIEERAANIKRTAAAIRTGVRYNDQEGDERQSPSVEARVYYNEPGSKTLREALEAIESLDYTFTGCFEA